MSDVAVVTACFGGYDEPRLQEKQEGYEDADWYYFTDEQAADPGPPWLLLRSDGIANDPRLAAKRFKLTPWEILQLTEKDYRWIVWIDANMEVTSPHFLNEALAGAACTDSPVEAWAHPRRYSAAAEVEASLTEAPTKYGAMADELRAQGAAYVEDGFPDNLGLWACGTLVWNMEHRLTRAFGRMWLAQCERWTIQDQVSFPFVAWKLGVTPGTFAVPQIEPRGYGRGALSQPAPVPYLENKWLRIWPHNRDD